MKPMSLEKSLHNLLKKSQLLVMLVLVFTTITSCGRSDTFKDALLEEDSALLISNASEIVTVSKNEPTIEETVIEADEMNEEKAMVLYINDEKVNVSWEDNSSVDALKELVSSGPLSINMSMYGGFEQVGSIGQSLPREDKQTTTASGDIVLYSGNQMVVFYGSNSWSYTRLGHIIDKDDSEIESLLSNGDVTITLKTDDN
ncbi:cyclophilin-like fold protein [Butyrivibrio sp. XPD2006]|uniref:cyclophilin-like fold protein n=1 Tax=Butyrivibrio sp. XPD2006 TaxID=1280668 RepID=UPI0003B6492F|nr:cyclophilin-like fold protein [Butyrivibrio sp. XPD2006]